MYKSGIYIITSKLHPNRSYVGSSCNLKARFARHKSELFRKKHHNLHLQRHVDKYGFDDLTFEIICYCLPSELISLEQSLIDQTKPFFNICPTAASRLGVKCNAVTRKKMRFAARSKKLSWYSFYPH